MKKLLLFVIVISFSLIILADDFMKRDDVSSKRNVPANNSNFKLKDRAADDEKDISYYWHVAPQLITDSKYDYFPASYNTNPITRQEGFQSIFDSTLILGNQMMMSFQIQQNNDRYVKGYMVDFDGAVNFESGVASATQRQGYGCLAIDPVTQRSYIAFHSDYDNDDEFEVKIVRDQYMVTEALSYTQMATFDNSDYGGNYGTQADDEYVWPNIVIRRMNNGVSRLFMFANNRISHNPITGTDTTAAASENVLFAYADLDDATGDVTDDGWTYKTFQDLNDWNMYTNDEWGRFQKGIYVSQDGSEVALFGYYKTTGTVDRFGIITPVIRAYYNDNYGEGDFVSYDKEINFEFPNPQFRDPQSDTLYSYFSTTGNISAGDSLFWSIYFGSHMTATQDSHGRFHVMSTLAPKYYNYTGTDTMITTYYMSTKVVEFVFDPNTAVEEDRIKFNAVYPEDKDSLGLYLADDVFPRVPWDVDNDGELDTLRHWTWNQYFLPLWHHDLDQDFHENYFRYARTEDGQWLAAMYGEGAMNYRTHDLNLNTHPMYEKPGCHIVLSMDNGDHWTDPVELYNVYDTEIYQNQTGPPDTVNFFYDQLLRNQFPNESLIYWCMGDIIEKPSDNVARIHVAFYADNKYGSSVQENDDDEVDEEGGSIYYGVIDVTVDYIHGNDDNLISKYEDLQVTNYPNPFNPDTHIQFNLKKEANVEVSIYNVKGQKVKQLADRKFEAGKQVLKWDGKTDDMKDSASGVYFIKVKTQDNIDIKKAILLK